MSAENPQGRGKLLPVLLVLNSLLLAAILAVVLLRPAGLAAVKPAPAAAEATAAPASGRVAQGPGPTLRLPDLTVRLRNPEFDRYARVGVEIELNQEEDRTAIQPYLPMLRDAYLGWFSDRAVEDLQGSDGLARAKEELLRRLEEIVPGRRVRALYITDFVVQ
jgi:flagellar basal body-associated protein FliL